MQSVLEELYLHQEIAYGDFGFRSTATVPREKIIGVRLPILRSIAKTMEKQGRVAAFLSELPHTYYEENLLHAILLSRLENASECLKEVELFLPWIDNWAICDTLVPKCFLKHPEELKEPIIRWLASDKPFTIRFGIGMLMHFFLGEAYTHDILELPSMVASQDYYVRMMVAWFYATAMIDHWDETLPYLQEGKLPEWTRKKVIQKAMESFRITEEKKDALRSLRGNASVSKEMV